MSGLARDARRPGALRACIVARLERAERLLAQAAGMEAPPALADDAALRREARRLRPWLESVAGRPYGRLPAIAYRRGVEARLAGPWSQYLTLGPGFTRHVRMTPLAGSRLAVPTILSHELAHRYAFDESVTTLRGLEVSARVAAEGDAAHAVAARLELARLLLGAAMTDALRHGATGAVDAFFAGRDGDARVERARGAWQRLRSRRAGGAAPDWASVVYAEWPVRALERALGEGRRHAAPLPFPRFPVDSLQAAAAWLYTGSDALTGRRRVAVPVDATLSLWRGAG